VASGSISPPRTSSCSTTPTGTLKRTCRLTLNPNLPNLNLNPNLNLHLNLNLSLDLDLDLKLNLDLDLDLNLNLD
jgi:hypothetical protein